MKICVTSQGKDLGAEVDPRFGRCRYFLIIDTETFDFEAVENGSASASGGAGIQSAQLVSDRKVETVLTGNVGPNAFETLHAAGIDVITGVRGAVSDAIESFKRGSLKPVQGPTVSSKSGLS
jgi:predicted Fe-Mo cluster-binding NifX family protein